MGASPSQHPPWAAGTYSHWHLRREHRPLHFSQLRGEGTGGLSSNPCGSWQRGSSSWPRGPAGSVVHRKPSARVTGLAVGSGAGGGGWCMPGCVGGDINSIWSRGGHI